MKLTEESKQKLALKLVVNLKSWLSSEDLDLIVDYYEADTGEYEYFRQLRSFALFLVKLYGNLETEGQIIKYVKSDLLYLLKKIKYDVVLRNLEMLNDK